MVNDPKVVQIRPLILIADKVIKGEIVLIDGNHYKDCIFIDCIIEWNDKYSYKMTNCQKFGSYGFRTKNPAITSIISGLKALWVFEQWFYEGWKAD